MNNLKWLKVACITGMLASFIDTWCKVFNGEICRAILWGIITIAWIFITVYTFTMEK